MTIRANATPTAALPRPLTGWLPRVGYWVVVASLIGLNAWWWWNHQPPMELKAIDGLIARGKLDDAERALRELLRSSPRHPEARMKLARLLGKREDYPGCARQLHEVAFWWPGKAEARFLEGQSYKQIDRARDAEAAWKAVIADDPLHPVHPRYFQAAAKELIGFYIMESRMDDARQTLWRAYEGSEPVEHAAVLLLRMRAELERIAHEEAVVTLRRFVAATPDDWEARRALALEEQLTNHDAEADRQIEACLKARPADLAVWRIWLEILHQRGDRTRVTAAVAKLPPTADQDAELWKFRGLVREWAGDRAGASEAFLRAHRLNPFEGEYLYQLGIAEQRLGQAEQASEHIRESRRLRQADADLHTAYYKYIDVSAKGRPGEPEFNAAVERLASLCNVLGWKREAEAWRRVPYEG
jgi:Flp pilus assembly protein TadD